MRHGTRGGAESGQIVVLSALVLSVLVGAGALAIDVGSLYSARGNVQEIADAASFAGAASLPESPPHAASGTCSPLPADPAGAAACSSALGNFGTTTLSPRTITWTTVGGPAYNQLQVVITANSPSILAGIFGVGSTDLTASSTAWNDPVRAARDALFAAGNDCSSAGTGITVSGRGIVVSGASHGNGKFAITGNNNLFGASDAGCTPTDTGSGNQFGSGGSQLPSIGASNLSYPESFDQATICGQPGAQSSPTGFAWAGSNLTIPSGIYCATCSMGSSCPIKLSGDHITGAVTFVGPELDLTGTSLTLSPAYQDLVGYITGTGNDLTFQGNGLTLTGATFYDPGGNIRFAGPSTTAYNGFFEAKTLSLTGTDVKIVGTGPASGPGSNHLKYTQ